MDLPKRMIIQNNYKEHVSYNSYKGIKVIRLMLLLLEQLLFYIEFSLFTFKSKYNKTIHHYSSNQNTVSSHRLAQVQPVFPLSTFHFQTKTGMLLKKCYLIEKRSCYKNKTIDSFTTLRYNY